MPSTGFYLFLLLWISFLTSMIRNRVNALNGLLLISSIHDVNKTRTVDWCQCPQRASTYFFDIIMTMMTQQQMCQCPQRASTYFFCLFRMSIPLNRIVSMPSTGFYLFLLWINRPLHQHNEVSMPSTGFYLFLPLNLILDVNDQKSVNALNGLLLISSLCCKFNKSWWHVSMPSTGFYLFLLIPWQRINM